jgi:hypothetical protein
MKVVAHHHIRMHPPAKSLRRFPEAALKSLGRPVPSEKLAPVIPAVDDVAAGPRKLNPKFPCHGRNRAFSSAMVKPPDSSSIGLVENSHMTPSDLPKNGHRVRRRREHRQSVSVSWGEGLGWFAFSRALRATGEPLRGKGKRLYSARSLTNTGG